MQAETRELLIAAMHERQRQLGFRLTVGSCIALCYGPLIGWRVTLAWLAAYAALQTIEIGCFHRRFGRLACAPRLAGATAVALLCANSAVFAGLSVPMLVRMGAWGWGNASFLLTGTMLSLMLNTIGSRLAMSAALAPLVALIMLLPLLPLALPDPPTVRVVIGNLAGGALILSSSAKLWRQWTSARDASRQSLERENAERLANEARLYRLAHHDPLTGLANRLVLRSRLAETTSRDAAVTLLLIDLDGFKFINDTLGHSAGDRMLVEVAARLARCCRPDDLVARIGGDEFALLLPGTDDPSHAVEQAERIIETVSEATVIDGTEVAIGASIGIAIGSRNGWDAGDLFAGADLALYRAKAEGRHCARVFDESLRAEAADRITRDGELRSALARGEFELFYQPLLRSDGRTVCGAEALLRWRHPSRGLLPPAAFLPALEGSMLASQVGDWVIETACAQAARWRSAGHSGFRVAVNLFGAQFRSGRLVERVVEILDRTGLPPDALELEITENIILRHEDEIVGPLRALHALGVGIAFDDYGTGYASLSLLKRYPLTRLKIDRSFIRSICESEADASIVSAVISMAKAFDLRVTAEGIETECQDRLLARLGPVDLQGYLFGPPVGVAEFARLHLAPVVRSAQAALPEAAARNARIPEKMIAG